MDEKDLRISHLESQKLEAENELTDANKRLIQVGDQLTSMKLLKGEVYQQKHQIELALKEVVTNTCKQIVITGTGHQKESIDAASRLDGTRRVDSSVVTHFGDNARHDHHENR